MPPGLIFCYITQTSYIFKYVQMLSVMSTNTVLEYRKLLYRSLRFMSGLLCGICRSEVRLGFESPFWTSTGKALRIWPVSPPAVLPHLLQLIHRVGPVGLVRGQSWGRGQGHHVPANIQRCYCSVVHCQKAKMSWEYDEQKLFKYLKKKKKWQGLRKYWIWITNLF